MKRSLCLTLLAWSGLAASLAAQDPVALIIRIQGEVVVSHAGGPAGPASVGEQIFVGDDISPTDGSLSLIHI